MHHRAMHPKLRWAAHHKVSPTTLLMILIILTTSNGWVLAGQYRKDQRRRLIITDVPLCTPFASSPPSLQPPVHCCTGGTDAAVQDRHQQYSPHGAESVAPLNAAPLNVTLRLRRQRPTQQGTSAGACDTDADCAAAPGTSCLPGKNSANVCRARTQSCESIEDCTVAGTSCLPGKGGTKTCRKTTTEAVCEGKGHSQSKCNTLGCCKWSVSTFPRPNIQWSRCVHHRF